jgi:hypothetical protein
MIVESTQSLVNRRLGDGIVPEVQNTLVLVIRRSQRISFGSVVNHREFDAGTSIFKRTLLMNDHRNHRLGNLADFFDFVALRRQFLLLPFQKNLSRKALFGIRNPIFDFFAKAI